MFTAPDAPAGDQLQHAVCHVAAEGLKGKKAEAKAQVCGS
jgi:hypothetical protein